jgi:hypothetical protein
MYLGFPSTLKIVYSDPSNMEAFEREDELSFITLEKDSILIDIHGRYYEAFMIKTSGYWATQRLADTLPYEYSPPGDIDSHKKN